MAVKKSFYGWLKKQKRRPDRVGDLARDALIDETFPKRTNTLKRLKTYLESQTSYEPGFETLEIAWEEFNKI